MGEIASLGEGSSQGKPLQQHATHSPAAAQVTSVLTGFWAGPQSTITEEDCNLQPLQTKSPRRILMTISKRRCTDWKDSFFQPDFSSPTQDRLFFFFFATCEAWRSQFPDQGLYPCSLKWKHGGLITGPPGNFPQDSFFFFVCIPWHVRPQFPNQGANLCIERWNLNLWTAREVPS